MAKQLPAYYILLKWAVVILVLALNVVERLE